MVRRGRRYPSRAARAQARISRDYPIRRYGRAYYERGTADNIARFGPSLKAAKEAAEKGDNSFLLNRRKYGYRGRGGYIGRSLGRFAGDRFGLGDAGALIGDKAGDWLWGKTKGLLGMGLYEGRGAYDGRVASNQLMAGSDRSAPKFQSVGDETGALVISHTEYIGDLYGNDFIDGSTTQVKPFQVRSYELNPGIERTFPWLSQIAQNYEEYEFGQLVFQYKATVNSTVAADGQVGSVVMATNYNASSRPFDEKGSMMQYDGSCSARTTASQVHGVECDPDKLSGSAGHYIRVKPKAGQDLKTYDHGTFQLATAGLPASFANETLGELWVYYTVKLRKPRLFSGKSLNVSRDMYVANTLGATVSGSSPVRFAAADTNNIGTKLVKASDSGAGSFYDLVFPASYSGSVEIRIGFAGSLGTSWTGDLSGALQVISRDATPSDHASTVAATARGLITDDGGSTGNIVVIPDMYAAYPKSLGQLTDEPANAFHPQWIQALSSADNSSANNPDRLLAIAHIRVSTATNGTDNRLKMWLPNPNEGDATWTMGQYSIEIQEYNTFDLPVSAPSPTFSLLAADGQVTKQSADLQRET